VVWTWLFGTHEYCSPTYYAVDLNGLDCIESLARQDRGRRQAAALRELVWTDVALNWYPAAARLAGTHSRSYNYLYGLGGLDGHAAKAGWLAADATAVGDSLQSAMFDGRPPARLAELSANRFPRLVRQRWGMEPADSRTHMLWPDVTLSTSGAAYGMHDMPLTVDLPGDRQQARCYFIADGREDAYGRKRYETGKAGHMKALHLAPFWAAAQRTCDALALAVYRRPDVDLPVVTNLQSHFVFRRELDGLWQAGRAQEFSRTASKRMASVPVNVGDSLVLRYGTAVIGIRLLWARTQDGRTAPAALVDDANRYGVLRLTVEHRSGQPSAEAGAALWVRVGTGLQDDAEFHAWRRRFEQARPDAVEVSEKQIRLAVPGQDGPVKVVAAVPFGAAGRVELEPPPCPGALELDGQEIGRPILAAAEPIRSLPADRLPRKPLDVPAEGDVSWEAEQGFLFPGMVAAQDAAASAGQFVWQPADQAPRSGSVLWPLRVAHAGRYYLWARTLAEDAQTDSCYVRLIGNTAAPVSSGSWHLRRGPGWQWQCLTLDKAPKATPLELGTGESLLEFRAREAGTKIDRLFLTSDPKQRPQ